MRQRIIAVPLLCAVVIAASACTAERGAGASSPAAGSKPLVLRVETPDGAWLDPAYSDGVGEPVSFEGALCGMSEDGTTLVTAFRPLDAGTPQVVGWDSRTGEQRWIVTDRGCVDGQSDEEFLSAHGTLVERRSVQTGEVVGTWEAVALADPEIATGAVVPGSQKILGTTVLAVTARGDALVALETATGGASIVVHDARGEQADVSDLVGTLAPQCTDVRAGLLVLSGAAPDAGQRILVAPPTP